MMLSAFAAEGCAAAPLLLSAGAPCINRTRCAIEIDIACPPGTQQQTHRCCSGTVLQRSIDVTDRQTDGHRTVTLTLPHTMPAALSINGPGTSFYICRYQKLDAEMSIWACKSTTASSLF